MTMKKTRDLPLSPLFAQYDEIVERMGLRGTQDCVIRTIACLSGKPYMDVWAWFVANTGYGEYSGLPGDEFDEVLDHFGIELEEVCLDKAAKYFGSRVTAFTPDRFADKWTLWYNFGAADFVAFCRDGVHVFPIIRGTVMDWTRGRRLELSELHRVVAVAHEEKDNGKHAFSTYPHYTVRGSTS